MRELQLAIGITVNRKTVKQLTAINQVSRTRQVLSSWVHLLKVGERLIEILTKLQTSVMYANAEPSNSTKSLVYCLSAPHCCGAKMCVTTIERAVPTTRIIALFELKV